MRISDKELEGAICPSSSVGVIQTRGLSAKAERVLQLHSNGFAPLAIAKMTYGGSLVHEVENLQYIQQDVVDENKNVVRPSVASRMAAQFQRWLSTVEEIIRDYEAQGVE